MSRRPSPASLLAIVTVLALCVGNGASRTAHANAFPTPGGAPGSTTGDGARPFTGLAETPRAAAFSGAAVTSIPLQLPPGRAGATPKLELRYASNDGPSAVGIGWSLPIARIARSTRRGVPRYDPTDTFVLETTSGSVELEPIAGTKRYVAKVEGGFLRIGFDAARNLWKVIDKSGTVMHFGTTSQHRTGRDVTQASETYAWLLAQSVDATRNQIDYTYVPDAAGTSSTGLLRAVEYGGNLAADVPHPFAVVLHWTLVGSASPPVVSYAAGFAVVRDRLLERIEVYVEGQRVRRYAMNHERDLVSGAARLIGVSLDAFAEDDAYDVALPSTVFAYSDSVATDWPVGSQTLRTLLSEDFGAVGPLRQIESRVHIDTFDIDGDALVDWVDARNRPVMVRRGTGRGFGPPQAWSWPAGAPGDIRHTDDEGNLDNNVFDITGDGLPDLVSGRGIDSWTVWRNTGTGFAATPAAWPAPFADIREASADGRTTTHDAADLNGDGRPDFINARTYGQTDGYVYWHVHWNTGSGFEEQATRFRAHRPYINRLRDSGSRRQLLYGLFDMNGDGLADFVVAPASQSPQDHWDVYLNVGGGFADEPLQWRIKGTTGYALPDYINETDGEEGESQTFVELVDMTGDGLPDLLRHRKPTDPGSPPACEQGPTCIPGGSTVAPVCCESLLLFVNTGTSFSAPVSWSAWHPSELRSTRQTVVASERQFDLLDVDGDGLVDLVDVMNGRWHIFRHPASPLAKWSSQPAEKRARPNLLLSMLNGIGSETHIEYLYASLYRDGRIPFPHWVVSKVEVRDGVSNTRASETSHLYRGGLWDGAEREFRGFRDVWQIDSARITVATKYHQDARLQGMVSESLVLGVPPCTDGDPMDAANPCSPLRRRMRVDLNTWSTAGPVLLRTRTSTPYFANAPIPELSKQTSYDYDAYGNVARETVHSPSAATVTTETAYAHSVFDAAGGMPGRYLVDKPTWTLTREATGARTKLSEESFTYDAPFPVTGLLKSSSRCIEWNATQCTRSKTQQYGYDAAGNVTRISGTSGGTTTSKYDTYLLYAESVRNAAGHSTFSVRELRSGRETLRRGASGLTFETLYDGLGRPVRSWSDGFDRVNPEVVTTYVEGTLDGAPGQVRTRQHRQAPVTIFFDGVGRRVAVKTRTETSQGEKTVVSGLQRYDAAGRVVAQGVTFEAVEANLNVLAETFDDAPASTRYVYDANGYLRETVLPDGSRTLHDTTRPGVRTTVHANLAGGEYPGKAEIELLDGLDRVWRKDVCSASPPATDPSRCPAGTLQERTEFDYDGLDRPIRTTGGAHTTAPTVTETRYDGLGNRVRFASSDHGTWSYEYRDDGLLAAATDPRLEVMTSTYDKLGRLSKQSARGFKARYVYHRKGAGAGLVRRIKSKSGASRTSKEFLYDTHGRVLEEEISLRASGDPQRLTTRYEYDSAGRRIAVTYPGENGEPRRVVTTYSPYGRPLALTAFDGAAATEIVRDVQYDLLGNVELVRYGNGLADVWGHAAAADLGHLQCLRTTRAATIAVPCLPNSGDERRVYVDERDTAGNILSLSDGMHGLASPLSDERTFEYDALGRLVRAARAGAAAETFAYDAHGNLRTSQGASYLYSAAAPHRPTLATDTVVEHDAAGNRTRKGAWTYQYDSLGRLTTAREGSSLRELAYYDEGSTRIARYDAGEGALRYYFGGRVEVEGSTVVRHYWLGDRVVASDTFQARRGLRMTAAAGSLAGRAGSSSSETTPAQGQHSAHAPMHVARAAAAHPISAGFTPDAVTVAATLTLLLLMTAALAGPARSGIAIIAAVTLLTATTPLPALSFSPQAARPRFADLQPSRSGAGRAVASAAAMVFYHPDHLGSPYLVSNAAGTVIEHHRYGAYGRTRGVFDDGGEALDEATHDISYTGKTADPASGLIYFGSRYYDPELGLFLTPDPQAQFASPYLYGGGNPVNGVDPDGELFGLIGAVLVPVLLSAAVSAFASGIAAGFQGGDVLEGFTSGFLVGLSGAALGTAIGGLNIAYQYAAGGAKFIEAAEAASAFVRVAARSSFTTAVSGATVSFAGAAGLPSDWVTAIAIAAPLLSSYAYDNFIIKDSGAAASGGQSQRQAAKDGVQKVNTLDGHTNTTGQAADQSTGYERHVETVTKYNKLKDGPAPSGHVLKDGWKQIKALSMNHDHFGRLPSSLDDIYRGVARGIDAALGDPTTRTAASMDAFFKAIGEGAHLVQDHLTLGHMVPGTGLLWGPPGAPLRFVIHQVFGGEIAFRNAQVRATRELLVRFPPAV